MAEAAGETPPVSKVAHPEAIFWIGVVALFTAGLSGALRAAIAGDLKSAYLDPIDLAQSAQMIASALGLAFLGFTLMLVVASTLLDKIGMKRMLFFAAGAFAAATLLLVFCGSFGGGRAPYYMIMAGMFVNGLAHGAVEGTINPMVGSLYPVNTTHRMNILHAWWPAGLIAGGLLGAFGAKIGLTDYRLLFAPVGIIGVAFAVMMLGREFPKTTSGELGVPVLEQLKETIRRPTFFIWFGLMLFTAASELAPGQWIDVALSNVVGMRGILLLVYVAGIQFVGRHFVGPLERLFSTEGLLCISSAICAVGLYLLGSANSPVTAMLAATAWGVGVCVLWPTMIAVAAERYPRGGAMTIGLMGVAGSISTYFVLPQLGAIYDRAKIHAAGSVQALETLSPEQMKPVLVYAAGESFRAVSLLPALLFVVFGLLWLLRLRASKA